MTSSASESDFDYSEESEETQSGSEESSGPEAKEHLSKDLESILKEGNLEAPGSYAYSSLLPFAPYPCLSIEGLGSIGLPLSETEAKRIIAGASQAPFGKGSQTIVNKDVRDTWEFDAARIKFENPNWDAYVQDLAIQTVCSNLRAGKHDTPPRCEFYKLLVYEAGSHFLPHRDTQKADGMFATMIILLPSQYTGGEVHLTHASKAQVIDFSASSLANTAVLAWYTDVLHEVKPVTSGYRLALSYNLIHTSSRVPLPMVPTYDGPYAQLRQVLCKWEEGGYRKPKKQSHFAYMLKHRYSEVNFSHGVSCLKGEDDERVALVRAAAEGLGIAVFLANLKYHVQKNTNEWDGAPDLEPRRGYDSDVSRDYSTSVDISLSNMVDLNGNVILGSNTSIEVDDHCFLPKDAIDDVEPDDVNQGYTGNEGVENNYWYHRSVFVLILSDQLPRVLIHSGGAEYVMKLFKDSLSENAPTEKDKNMAKVIIGSLQKAGDDKVPTMKGMLNYAFEWKDIEMWRDLTKSCGGNIEVQGEDGLAQAWRIFKFDQTRESIENMLCKKPLPARLTYIDTIRQAASEFDEKDVIQEWCSNQVTVALASYISPDVKDVPLLVSMACENGIQSISEVPIEKIAPGKEYVFLIALVKALHPKEDVILEKTAARCAGSDDPQSKAVHIVNEFIKSCLDCVGKQCDERYQRQTRMLEVIELCLLTRQMDPCRDLLDWVWNVPGEVVDKFNEIYIPLVPELCKLLQKTDTDVCAPPFNDFFRLLISHHLCHVLGTKKQQKVRKIGCGCADCRELGRFLAGKESQHTFGRILNRSSHLVSQMDKGSDILTYRVDYYRDALLVTKTSKARSACMWVYRLDGLNDMLNAIGMENVEKIMGDRYADVCKALEGEAFRLDEMEVDNVDTTTSESVIGEKRKRELISE